MVRLCLQSIFLGLFGLVFLTPLLAYGPPMPSQPTRGFQMVVPEQRSTYFIGLEHNTALSRKVSQLRNQGYELSNGGAVVFNDWYSTHWQDLHLSWMTQLNRQWGLVWGFGTGERGAKYTIDPSVQLGFVFQQPLSRHTTLSVRATTRLGGRLREKPCMAVYTLQGYDEPQPVNCRLAATQLAPEDTLPLLFNDSPLDRMRLHIRYMWVF
jgi:hypothetical protein